MKSSTVYEELFHFLRIYGAKDFDFDEVSYEESAYETFMNYPPSYQLKILEQLRLILLEPDFPWTEIKSAINRTLTEEEVRSWCLTVLNVVAEIRPRFGLFFLSALSRNSKNVLKTKYPFFEAFLQSYMKSDCSDEETTRSYASTVLPEDIDKVILEGKQFIEDPAFPWDEINNTARECFAEPKDFREWVAERIAEIICFLKAGGHVESAGRSRQ